MVDLKEKLISEAMNKCDYFIKNNANINVIEGDLDSIEFHTYTTDAVEVVLDALKEMRFLYPQLLKSDASKELSSMNYYNEMRYWQDKAKYISDISCEMLKYIVNHTDCPLENEGFEFNCEHRCNTDEETLIQCWKEYFKSKVVNKDGKSK